MQLIRKSLLASAIFSICSGAMAAGFQITEHSAKALGRANAGEAAVAEDASVVASNPALMTQLTKPVVTLSGSYIMPNIDIEGTATNYFVTGASPVYTGQNDVAPNAFVPAAYFVLPINELWTFGFGGFGNFGLKTDYNDRILASTLADETDLVTMNFNPSLAYKVDDSFSVGFGLNLVYADATISSSMPAAAPAPFSGQLLTKLEGDDYGYGWNLGLYYRFSDATQVGFSYRSKVDLTLEGEVDTGIIPQLKPGVPAKFDDSVDLTLPALWELALNQKLTDTLSVQASVNRIEWSEFDRLRGNTTLGASILNQEEQWDDSWAYSLGLTYIATQDITLRAGLKFDESPVADEHRTLRIPDSDRVWYSLGMTYRFSPNFEVDVAYNYLDSDEADINEGAVIKDGNPSPAGQFNGTMKGDADIFSLQASYRF